MTRTDIANALQKSAGGQAFITAKQLAIALGEKNMYRVKQKYLSGLEAVGGNRYLITEVAEQLKNSCRIG